MNEEVFRVGDIIRCVNNDASGSRLKFLESSKLFVVTKTYEEEHLIDQIRIKTYPANVEFLEGSFRKFRFVKYKASIKFKDLL